MAMKNRWSRGFGMRLVRFMGLPMHPSTRTTFLRNISDKDRPRNTHLSTQAVDNAGDNSLERLTGSANTSTAHVDGKI